MSGVSIIRQDEDLRTVKHFLTSISNRRAERYYYPDGSPKYSVIQIDSILAMDVIDRLVTKIETLETEQTATVKPVMEVRKRRLNLLPSHKWWVKRKVVSGGIAVNYTPWWGRPFEIISNAFR